MSISERQPAQHPERIGRLPLRPLVALRAFRKLTQNKEDTLQVFEILRALSGGSLERQFLRLLRDREGSRQAYCREELADILEDDRTLAGYPQDTVAAYYRRFVAPRKLSAYGLADESRRLGEADIDAAHPIAWYMRRQRDAHDLWHVLTGYSTDALGEACVLAFTFAQTGNFAIGFIAGAAALELKRSCPSQAYLRAVHQAWLHGRRAAWFMALDYEQLLREPLIDARRRLGIARPTAYDAVPGEARNAYRYPAEGISLGAWPVETA